MVEKYICGYCGAEYGTPVERAKCEFECDEKQKQEAERVAKEKLKAEKESREESVRVAYQNFVELYGKYIKDYREPVAFKIGSIKDGQEVSAFLDSFDNISLLDRLFQNALADSHW